LSEALTLERQEPRVLRVIKANETPAAKSYRLAAAIAREFAREYPKEAVEIVRKECLDKQK